MNMPLLVLTAVFFVLTLLSVPVCYSIWFASLAALLAKGRVPLTIIPQRMFSAVDSFTLLAVPFFIIAGDIMMRGGISSRLIRLAKVLVGSAKGGMAYVTFLASAFFGALSGSSNATTMTIGGMMQPVLEEDQYPPDYAAAIGATAGSLGVLIPPSIAFVLVGSTNGVSIGDLFKMGVIVGIFALVGYCIIVKLTIKRMCPNVSAAPKASIREIWEAIKDAFWAILSPLIILGGIYSGVFTPTEAAVVSIVYSIIVSMFIYKEMTIKELLFSLKGSALTSGKSMLIAATSGVLSWIVTSNGLVKILQDCFSTLHVGAMGFLLIANVLYFILGMLLDPVPIFILTTPIMLPIALTYQINALHFCTLIVFNVVFGVITPPFGCGVFTASMYSKQPSAKIFVQCKYFLVGGVIMTIIVTYFPLLLYFR